ncbi:MAG: hypothetical protein AB8B69_01120 [Chitinophagales bacterium]
MSAIFNRFQILLTLCFLVGVTMTFTACEEPGGGDDPCQTVNCINGDCLVSATGDPFCNCDPGFSGPTCETPDCSIDCGENGNCVTDASGVESCECINGYSGVDCLTPPDPCFNVECPTNASCVVDAGEAFCECNFGYEGDNCDIEVRSKFLGTYTGQVDYTDGDVFTDFTENVTVTADPNDVEQFFINSFEDFSIPAPERFTFTAKAVPIDQKANTFEIVGSHTSNYVLDGTQYQVTYTGVGLGTRSETTGRIVVEYKVEDFNPSSGESLGFLNNILTLTPQ